MGPDKRCGLNKKSTTRYSEKKNPIDSTDCQIVVKIL